MKSKLLGLILFVALIAPAGASEITYGVNIQENAFSIAGTITTDGTVGALSNSDVTAYDLVVSIPGATPITVACGTACVASFVNCTLCGTPIGNAPFPSGPALFATSQYLLFNFVQANSNYIILGQNAYPTAYVEFYDHVLIDAAGEADDEGIGAIQVGGGGWYGAVRTAFCCNLNLPQYSADGTYVIGTAAAAPLPAALPLFATGLGGLGLLGWRRKRKAQAI